MYRDEGTLRLVKRALPFVSRPNSVLRCDALYTFKTVKRTDSVIVWDSFTGNKGRRGLYFLLSNFTTSGSDYIKALSEYLPDLSGNP